MKVGRIEEDVVVHPVDGMQLTEGYIREDESHHFVGSLPGIVTVSADTIEDVLVSMEHRAKDYYGDDVVVEITHHHVVFS